MVNVGFITDTHLIDRPPLSRVDDYRASLFRKLKSVGRIAQERSLDILIHGGDVFHEKRANRVRYSLTGEVVDVLNAYPCPVYVLPGNHDQNPGGLTGIPDQPISILGRAPNIKLLQGPPMSVQGKVWIVPRPFTAVKEVDPDYYRLDNHDRAVITHGLVIMAAHGPLLPPKDDRPYPYLPVDSIDTTGIDLILAGHIHEPLGVHTLDDGTVFANPGSLCRVSRTQSNLTRTPAMYVVTIHDSGSFSIEEVPIPGIAPGSEVFRGSEVEQQETVSDEIREFVDALGEGLQTDELPLEDIVAASDGNSRVQQLITRLLEEAEV